MTRSQVYTRAAEIMADEGHPFHCCHAIAKAINGLSATDYNSGDLDGEYKKRIEEFSHYFQPDYKPIWWWPNHVREERVLALCFMAAIVGSTTER